MNDMDPQVRNSECCGQIEYDSIKTRQSLLSRLKNRSDDESWMTFYDTYRRPIYNTAVKAGLRDPEAKDVVQETIISVMKIMPNFHYDQKKGRFKAFLMRITRRRIADEFRKRDKILATADAGKLEIESEEFRDELDSVPDQSDELSKIWESEWEENLSAAALERVKKSVDLKQYQIFDLFVFKNMKVSQIAETMGVNRAHVYLIKHRIQNLLKKECEQIRQGAGY
jgi:RNA polymerase sigma factor (sigma-70 family)